MNKLKEEDIKLKFMHEDLRRKRLDTQTRFLFKNTVTLSVILTVLFSFISLFPMSDRKSVFLFPFDKNADNSKSIEKLENENLRLREDLNKLNENFTDIQKQSSNDKDLSVLNSKLDNLFSNINALNETILEKPDTAITAKLLREKQANLDQKIDSIAANQQRLENKVDGFLSNLIAVPFFAALAGFIFTTIAAIISPLLTKLKNKFTSSDKDVKSEL